MAITLVERLYEHCVPSIQQDGYGALLGGTYPLRPLVEEWFGRKVEVSPGVLIVVPHNCEWKTSDLADGSVQITFSGETVPALNIKHLALSIWADIPAIVVRLGAAAFEAKISLRRFPDFNLTIPLRGGGDSESA